MTNPLTNLYRLSQRGGPGLSCDADGVALGPVVLIEKLVDGKWATYRLRPSDEVGRAFALAYDGFSPHDTARCLAGLAVAARALEAADHARAAVATVQLMLPALSAEGLTKLAADASLIKFKPNQPRDERGRWIAEDGNNVASGPRTVRSNVAGTVIATIRDRPSRRTDHAPRTRQGRKRRDARVSRPRSRYVACGRQDNSTWRYHRKHHSGRAAANRRRSY